MIGGWEVVVILFVALMLFGDKKLIELARNLGRGIRQLGRASQGLTDEATLESGDRSKTPSNSRHDGRM